MRVAIIGKGNVGKALGPNIAATGREVVYGVRSPENPKHFEDDGIAIKRVGDAASQADIVILAINWPALDEALGECGDMTGKVVVDCINPYDFHNNLAPLIPMDQSAAKIIARKTSARVVKAFNQVGAEVMAGARHRRPRPLQFIASDDNDAKATILQLANDLGFDARDAGNLDFARELEGMARLWIAQAFFQGMSPTSGWLLATD